MEAVYLDGMKKKGIDRGRPKADPAKAYVRRHVVNITPELEDRIRRYADENGIARLTDAIRQLLVRVTKELEP